MVQVTCSGENVAINVTFSGEAGTVEEETRKKQDYKHGLVTNFRIDHAYQFKTRKIQIELISPDHTKQDHYAVL